MTTTLELAKQCGWVFQDDMPYLDVQSLQDALLERLKSFRAMCVEEALKNARVQIPTETMEQEFSTYHRRGYAAGKAESEQRIKELEKQVSSYKSLANSQTEQLSVFRKAQDATREAISTLESERKANSMLTERIAELEAQLLAQNK